MNQETLDSEHLEGQQWSRDSPRAEEAAVTGNPDFATTTCSREREPPPGGTRRFATRGTDDEETTGFAYVLT